MKKSKKKRGSSILLVLVITAAILVFSAATISAVNFTMKGNDIQIKEDDLFYIAEAGFEHGYAKLMSNGNEDNYTKVIDNLNVEISITKEREKFFRIRSKATDNGNHEIVQGLVEDKRVGSTSTKYSEIISKYVINAEGVSVGMQGSVNLHYVNSKTEIVKSPNVQVSAFEQPDKKPTDTTFAVPNLKNKHSNKLEFRSMKELIDSGIGKENDKENNSVVTEVINLGVGVYSVVFANTDLLEINVPAGGEVLQNIIIVSPGTIKINSKNSTAMYAYMSMVCKDLNISNEGFGTINMSPQPFFNSIDQKDILDDLINKYVEPSVSGGGTTSEWVVEEMHN